MVYMITRIPYVFVGLHHMHTCVWKRGRAHFCVSKTNMYTIRWCRFFFEGSLLCYILLCYILLCYIYIYIYIHVHHRIIQKMYIYIYRSVCVWKRGRAHFCVIMYTICIHIHISWYVYMWIYTYVWIYVITQKWALPLLICIHMVYMKKCIF